MFRDRRGLSEINAALTVPSPRASSERRACDGYHADPALLRRDLPKEIEYRFRLFNDRDRPALGIDQAHLRVHTQGVIDRGGELLG